MQVLLDQIDRLEPELATAPWFVANSNENTEYMPFWQVMNHAYLNDPGTEDDVYCDVEMYVGSKADAEFIALARTALPKLAEAVYHVLDLLDVVEKSDKYSYDFGGNKAPSLVTTNEVRRAITDALEDQ